jgi:hypothetical protein
MLSLVTPPELVWDREGAIHAGNGRPTEEFAAFCGQLAVGWLILEPADPESKGERSSDRTASCVNDALVGYNITWTPLSAGWRTTRSVQRSSGGPMVQRRAVGDGATRKEAPRRSALRRTA